MKRDNQKIRKYIAAFFAAATLLLAAEAGLSTASALAAQTGQQTAELASQTNDGNGNVTPPSGDDTKSSSGEESKASSAATETSSAAGSGAGSAGSSGNPSAGSGTSSLGNDLITVTFNLNGGTGMKTVAHLERGTSVSQLKIPTRSGYRFTGWSRGGAILSDSKILDSDTTLTANWKMGPAGQNDSTASVNTRQNEVDAAASAAKQAVSDPDVLSSQDWNSILSASSESGSAVSSQASSSQASSAAQSSGGFSMLLAGGIGLILLGVAGVIAFIYLQFIRRPPGGPRGGSGGGRHLRDDDTMTFTDVSSYSGGHKPDDASAVLYPQTPPRPSSPASGGEKPQAREARRSSPHAAPPKTDDNFDWERFFNGAER